MTIEIPVDPAADAMSAVLSRLAGLFETVAVPRRGRTVAQPARADDGSAYR